MARKIITEGYYKSIYEVQKGFGLGFDISDIDDKELNLLVFKPWAGDGKNFSSRIWQRKGQMVNDLQKELTRNLILGKAPDEAIKNLERFVDKKIKNSRNAFSRLVMTESAYFHSLSKKKAFDELDVEEYEIVATLDSRTSEICQDMDCKWLEWVENPEKGYNAIKISGSYYSKAKFKSQKSLDQHYDKHKDEFENINKEKYLEKTKSLLAENLSDNILGFMSKEKFIFKYDIKNNEFVVLRPDGRIATFMKPKRGLDYWNEQEIKYGKVE
ncbi:minor capsid protein [uncultured Anaerococcus sp.]|uniref:minor capsid protein n=1 Tax=uncultured Anaerococcus sp. TaxID=293428 RepID=UPI0028037733|nr:minor capsid protein [uncultured Anaerococcus sp.]